MMFKVLAIILTFSFALVLYANVIVPTIYYPADTIKNITIVNFGHETEIDSVTDKLAHDEMSPRIWNESHLWIPVLFIAGFIVEMRNRDERRKKKEERKLYYIKEGNQNE